MNSSDHSETAKGEEYPLATGLTVCFFLSGLAGLIYEVAWAKALGLLFGITVYASATVLAAFMAGLAAGSRWFGSKAEQIQRPIDLYGWIELAIAVTGGASIAGLAATRQLYYRVYPTISASPISVLGVRFLGAALVLIVPSFLMGGTFPILLRGYVSRRRSRDSSMGLDVSHLYWINTSGAVAGAMLAGFALLPMLGIRLTVACAVLLNVCAGGIALLLSRYCRQTNKDKVAALQPTTSTGRLKTDTKLADKTRFLLVAFGLVGATALMYEIAWARILATPLGSSTYSFTLMLATFLLGIMLGSMLYERWCQRHQNSSNIFSLTQTLTALAALLFLVLIQKLPAIIPWILTATHQTFGGLVLGQFVVIGIAMLPAAVVFGFNFPAVVALIGELPSNKGRIAEITGKGYAANTLGAIIAAVFTGFFLVPWLSSYRVVALAGVINICLAMTIQWQSTSLRMRSVLVNCALLVCILGAGWSRVFFDPALASFGTVLYWDMRQVPLTLHEAANAEEVVFLEEGLNATISVARSDNYVALRTNGKVDASTVDANTQILLGDLAAVFHPNPQRILVIGFGSGMTASAVSRFPEVAQIDCIEIEPAVLRAAPYLERLNRGVLQDTRLKIIHDDARNALFASQAKYDLIISEPSNPWIAGVANLFTSEFYAEVRHHLAPGGSFVQWVQAYSLEPHDLKMIVATLAPEFSNLTLWQSAGADFLLFARTETTPLDFSRSRRLWSNSGLREDFSILGLVRPESWAVYFCLSDRQVRALAAGGDINSDDRTLLEYRAPHALVGGNRRESLQELIKQYSSGLLPTELKAEEIPATLEASAESSLDLNPDRSAGYMAALANANPTAELETMRGRLALQENRVSEAIDHLNLATRLDTNNLKAMYWLAMAEHSARDEGGADDLVNRILGRDPRNMDALRARVALAKDRHDWRTGAKSQLEFISAQKEPQASEFCALGDLWLRAGDLSAAEDSLSAGLQREPYSYLCHRELGEVTRLLKRYGEAQNHLELVVRMYPEMDPGAYVSLALVYRAQGHPSRASEILAKGRRIFPGNALIARVSSY